MTATLNSWVLKKLGEVATAQSGGTPSRAIPEYWNGEIPWVKISDIDSTYVNKTDEFITQKGLDNSSTRIFPKGTILLTIFATIGRVGILEIDASTNQAIAGITPNKEVDKKFLYYCLVNYSFKLVEQSKGVAQKNINLSILKNLEIPVPTLYEQKRIVNKLDTLFKHLDQLKARLQNIPTLLKQFRQAVLTQAVTGKLTEEWRAEKQLESYLNEISTRRKRYYEARLLKAKETGTKPKKLEESEFDTFEYNGGYDIPAYWELANLKNICDLITDGEHATPERTPDGFLLLSARNVQNGYLSLKTVDYVPESEFIRIKKRCNPEPNDILISCSGTIGRVCKVPKELEFVLVRSVALLKLQSNIELSSYVEYTLRSEFVQNQMLTLQKATAQANLFIGPIGKIVVPIPSFEEQKQIVHRVESLFAVADRIEASYYTLQEKIDHLPKAILSKAFRGQLNN